MSKGWWLLLIFIIVLSGVLRLYKLSDIPVGLYADEASIGYNAYSILKTGRDEHGFFSLFGLELLGSINYRYIFI